MTQRSNEILVAARDLIVESGGALPTVREIAARSFLSPAAIYVHFANADRILTTVRRQAIGELVEAVRATGASSFADAARPAAAWMLDNRGLTVAITQCAAGDLCDEAIELLTSFLGDDLGEPDVPEALLVLAAGLSTAIPPLIDDLAYGVDELANFLLSLAEPLRVVRSQKPIEVISA